VRAKPIKWNFAKKAKTGGKEEGDDGSSSTKGATDSEQQPPQRQQGSFGLKRSLSKRRKVVPVEPPPATKEWVNSVVKTALDECVDKIRSGDVNELGESFGGHCVALTG